jgi:hypothetical protein
MRRRRAVVEFVGRPSKSESLDVRDRPGDPRTGPGESFPPDDQHKTKDQQEQPKHVGDLCSRM